MFSQSSLCHFLVHFYLLSNHLDVFLGYLYAIELLLPLFGGGPVPLLVQLAHSLVHLAFV